MFKQRIGGGYTTQMFVNEGDTMKRIQASFLFSVLLGVCSIAQAANYPLVLVHGFQPSAIGTPISATQLEKNGVAAWSEFWGSRAQARIDWPSQERIAEKIATEYVWPKLKQLSVNGTCKQGCIFVIHSAGDLVTRYILDNQALWLTNAGLEPLKIIATFDFGGAGGGSELADIAVNAASGSNLIDKTVLSALSLWLGKTPTPATLGVLTDLRVNTARHIAPFPDARVPRLRFIGNGSDFAGATSLFLPGADDGVVSAHSSCGASTAEDFESCSRSLAFDGKVTTQTRGVANFMPYHYAMLMGEKYSHGDTKNAIAKSELAPVNASATFLNSGGLRFNTLEEKRGFWIFSSTYRIVKDSNRLSMSDVVASGTN